MKENFEYKGEWFLPFDNKKENRIAGILTYDKNKGSFLELFGAFSQNGIEQIIQGITSNSKKFTLYNCFAIKAEPINCISDEESGTPSTTYRVNYTFEGVHINAIEEMKFKKIVAEINQLDEWLALSGFSNPKYDEEKCELDIHYKIPETISFPINNKLNGELKFILNAPPRWSLYTKKMTITQTAKIAISSTSELSLEDSLSCLYKFQSFLILGLYEKTYPTSIELYTDNERVKLYIAFTNMENDNRSKFFVEMFFSYRDIREDFTEIIKKWYAMYDKLEPAFNILFDQFHNNKRFTVNSFLNLAQAAETFHARTDSHTKMPKEDFKKMQDDIYKVVPKEYHNWLKAAFSYGNSLDLHNRLTEMVDKYSNSVIDELIGDKELFIKKVKWSRNYYTHYSSEGKKNAVKGQELIKLTENLKVLLVCAFLTQVGFNKESLGNLLRRIYVLDSDIQRITNSL